MTYEEMLEDIRNPKRLMPDLEPCGLYPLVEFFAQMSQEELEKAVAELKECQLKPREDDL